MAIACSTMSVPGGRTSWGTGIRRSSAAVREALAYGTSFGAPTEIETALAEMIIDALPSIERCGWSIRGPRRR